MGKNRGEFEINLNDFVYVVRERIWLILAVTLVFGLGSGLCSYYFVQPRYSSSSKIYILSQAEDTISVNDLYVGEGLAKDYLELVGSRTVVEQMIENLHLDMTYEEVRSMLSIVNSDDTRILTISAEASDPIMAKEMVEEMVNISREKISNIIHVEPPSIVEEAYINEDPVNMNFKRNIILGLFLGVILSTGIAFLRHVLDGTVRSTDDIEYYLQLITLSVVPYEKRE